MATLKKFKALLKSANFFPVYAPGVTNMKNKLRGESATGKKLSFSRQDKKEISAGIDKMYSDLKKEIDK